MIKSNVIVEQINSSGELVDDYGEILSPTELGHIISKYFRCAVDSNGVAYGNYKGNQFCVLFKNVSYLGIPHPTYKKRIQIPNSYLDIYESNSHKNIFTFFIGVYTYKENTIFVNFGTEKYVKRKAHNSSAHVLAIDLLNATKNGHHFKVDKNDNEIFCFSKNNVNDFFERYISQTINKLPKLYQVFNEFYDSFPKHWNGIDCYNEMFAQNYHRKGQPEWQGSYIEYLFERFASRGDIAQFVRYSPQRNGIAYDLDLFFPHNNEFGDLKMHSTESSAILGNKTETILDCIQNNGLVYYFVYNHNTERDYLHNYETTIHWNTLLGKEDLFSYKDKMKHSINIKNYQILKIDKNNICYLKDFQNGFTNSDGNPRSSKIRINNTDLNNFLLYEHS